ncbi:MAG: serine hydrolase domain-containing protein [Candidatus Tectimicrobiota bacterium]
MRAFEKPAALLHEAVETGAVPGAVARVGVGDALLWEEAVGWAALTPTRRAATAETVYDVASVTKVAATASATCLLVGRGTVGLDDPAGRHLPDWPPDKAPVTVRHLLSHTAGFPGWKAYGRMWLEAHDLKGHEARPSQASRTWVLGAITRDDLITEPGEAWTYSDPGFIVLWELLEEVAGEPLEAVLTRELFGPLGMNDTFFVNLTTTGASPVASDRLAPTEDCPTRGRLLCGEVHDLNAWALGGVAGHAGLFSTAADLHRLGAAWLAAIGEKPDGPFDPKSATEFVRLQRPELESPYALGWDSPQAERSLAGGRLGPAARGHWGYTGCSLWLDPARRLLIILATNRPHPHDTPPEAMAAFRPRFHEAAVAAAEEALR